MKIIPTLIDGCFEIQPFVALDERGIFVKTFNVELYSKHGIATDWREEYYSRSQKGVIRGMHFQVPPHDHAKIVHCLHGKVLDVVLDLRKQSPTFGCHVALELDGSRGHGLFIPKGLAHGFLALTDDVLMAYKVETTFSPDHDTGIRWDSFGLDWGIRQPIMSARDRLHTTLADFTSPF